MFCQHASSGHPSHAQYAARGAAERPKRRMCFMRSPPISILTHCIRHSWSSMLLGVGTVEGQVEGLPDGVVGSANAGGSTPDGDGWAKCG